MKLKHIATIPADAAVGVVARWVITYEPKRGGRWFAVNVPQDIGADELDQLFVEAQITIAEKQAAMAAKTDPAIPVPK